MTNTYLYEIYGVVLEIRIHYSVVYPFQICVLKSGHHNPSTAEYGVCGTTYAPEGIIFENDRVQVKISACFFSLKIKFVLSCFMHFLAY